MQKIDENFKQCSTCRELKLISEFNKDRTQSDGLMNQCKMCKRKYRTSAKYRERERELEKTELWKHRRSKNGHYNRLKSSNPLVIRDINEELSFDQWQTILTNQEYRCAICDRPFTNELKYTRDCMIPLSKGGKLTFDNTQALCNHCNASKHYKAYSGLGNSWRLDYIS